MSEVVEQKVVDTIDQMTKIVSDLTGKMSHLAEVYGPDVVNATLNVIRVDGIQTIVSFVILLLFGIGFLVKARQLWNNRNNKLLYTDGYNSGPTPAGVIFFIFTCVGVTIFGIAIGNLADVWEWIKIFYPELYIVKSIVHTVIK